MEKFNEYIEVNDLEEKEYQRDGVEWCMDLEQRGRQMGKKTVHGGILADEMGLGKTTQMIGLIISNEKANTLIVVPRALLEQWNNVLMETLGKKGMLYHGTKKVKDQNELKREAIVLTTYGTLARRNLLHEISWGRVIFDEAHHLRNKKSLTHEAGVNLKSKHKWLVTGTPIQNTKKDLYSLCKVVGIEEEFYSKDENLEYIVDNLILKRTKEGVGLKLPPLNKHIINVAWKNEAERQLSEDIHAQLRFSHVSTRPDNIFIDKKQHTLVMLQKARQSCIKMELLAVYMNKLNLMNESIVEALQFNSKLDKVIETIVERKNNGKCKLIFCHYHEEITSLIKALTDNEMKCARFDGNTPKSTRHQILSDNSLDVIVLQIQTGCEGLNLQQFSEVYFVSPSWNPAVEDQAIARCHRIGQKEATDVFIFRMTSFDKDALTRTIDMYARDIQQKKRVTMKIIDIHKNNVGKEMEEECAICMEKQHENTCQTLGCGHYFHCTCLETWFEKNKTCPMCRA